MKVSLKDAEKYLDFFSDHYTRDPFKNERSVIVGLHRCGAKTEEISECLFIAPVIVCAVIEEYFIKINSND